MGDRRDDIDDIIKIAEPWQFAPPADSGAGGPDPDGGGDELLGSGPFSRRSRLSPKALRLYDEQGLLRPARVDAATGYRGYRVSQLAVARLISTLRRLDMPIATVAEIIAAPRAEAATRLDAYWREVEAKVAVQREIAAHIRRRLTYGDEESDLVADVALRDVPRQVVLCEQRHVLQSELVGFIEEAMPRVAGVAYGDGRGLTGPLFVVFHGEVSYDSDGPVEVCAPVDRAFEGRADHAIRVESAHREAYVRIRKAQVGHPQILSAYDAVAAWIHRTGRAIGGPPREVYFHPNFVAASAADEVCDVAFPVLGGI